LDCYFSLTTRLAVPGREWLTSIHAEYEVSCTECHDGDPLDPATEGAMSVESGYIGQPPKDQMPDLCRDCQGNSERMTPYGLPTRQLSECYKMSKHGRLPAQGDQAVATCYHCAVGMPPSTLNLRTPLRPR
jgi:hypothetical protein